MRTLALFLIALAPCLPVLSRAAEPDRVEQDQRVLTAAGLRTDGAALLQFFRARTLRDNDLAKIQTLVKQLGDDSFDKREQASRQLGELGPPAEKSLREATQSADPEVKKRAEDCLIRLAKGSSTTVIHAAARLLAARKSVGAVQALFDYVPYAADEDTVETVCVALGRVAVKEGKADTVLLDGLSDKNPVKRAASAAALLHAGLAQTRPAILKLLRDPEWNVRSSVARLLLEKAREREAVPVLIELLADVPQPKRWEIEELLGRVAGDKAAEANNRGITARDAHDAWSKWWKENGDKIDLAKLDLSPRYLGRTLIVERAVRGKVPATAGRVYEVDRDGKVLWEIGDLRVPTDARWVGKDRVLICESQRVTQRNLKGEVLWTYHPRGAVQSAQPLASGNTFVACRNVLAEVDKDGKEVSHVDLTPASFCYAAERIKDGRIAMVSSIGKYSLLDAEGKELKSFPVDRPLLNGGIGVMPDGSVVVASYRTGKVLRYDTNGRAVWEAAAQMPSSVSLLPNGNVLVTCARGTSIVELDREGKEVRKIASDGRAIKAYGR